MKAFPSYFKDPTRINLLSPLLMACICEVLVWCLQGGIEPVISDTVSDLAEDTHLKRTSSTHREGRAFDLSTKGWTTEQISECIDHFTGRFLAIGAIGQDGTRRPVYYHDAGTGFHLHFQLERVHAMPVPTFSRLT